MLTAAERRVFLTKPSQFQIKYSINPWMNPKNQVDAKEANKQWEALFQTYLDLGVPAEAFEPVKGWPDSVFIGDSIFLYGQHAIASRFRYPERSGEVEPIAELFRERGYQLHTVPDGLYFEGNGEAIAWNDMILIGYGVRSDRAALDFVSETLGVKVVPIRVLPPHFHVDTCICPLDDHTLAYVPSGMDEQSLTLVQTLGVDLIEIDQEEAVQLACNSMAVDRTVILSTHKAPLFSKALEKADFNVLPLDLGEFAKSGGGAKCLTLEAYKPN
ncbi:MAG: arginine deiminase-related protein [Anaerolineales bacterium]